MGYKYIRVAIRTYNRTNKSIRSDARKKFAFIYIKSLKLSCRFINTNKLRRQQLTQNKIDGDIAALMQVKRNCINKI